MVNLKFNHEGQERYFDYFDQLLKVFPLKKSSVVWAFQLLLLSPFNIFTWRLSFNLSSFVSNTIYYDSRTVHSMKVFVHQVLKKIVSFEPLYPSFDSMLNSLNSLIDFLSSP